MSVTYILEFALLIFAAVIGLYRYRILSAADRVLAVLLTLSVITETTAFAAVKCRGNNMAVYNLYSPLELLLIALYFDRSVGFLHRLRIGAVTGLAGIILAAFIALRVQPLTSFNAYFLIFEDCAIIMLSLLSLAHIAMDAERPPFVFAQFWITALLVLYWSATYCGWGLFEYLNKLEHPLLHRAFGSVLALANYLFYTGIAAVFIRYPKLLPSGARA